MKKSKLITVIREAIREEILKKAWLAERQPPPVTDRAMAN